MLLDQQIRSKYSGLVIDGPLKGQHKDWDNWYFYVAIPPAINTLHDPNQASLSIAYVKKRYYWSQAHWGWVLEEN